VPVLVQVPHRHLDAERVVAAHPFQVPPGDRPSWSLPLDEHRRNGQLGDPAGQFPVLRDARREQQPLHLAGVDEPGDLAPVLVGVVARSAQLDVHAQRARGGPRTGDDRRPVVVQRRHHHADREPGRRHGGPAGRAQAGRQRRAAVHLGEQVALGERGEVAPHGQFADAEQGREVTDAHRAEPAQFLHQAFLALDVEHPVLIIVDRSR
jgi:hypothetical protein